MRIALNLKRVDYVSINTSLLDDDHKQADYLVRNPQGFVPMLSIDGENLTQSLAIIDYLDAKFREPALVSSEPLTRAKTLAQAMVVAADIHPVNNLRVLRYLKHDLSQEQDALDHWYRHWIVEGFAALEDMAPDSPFFGGDSPNLADICLVPQIYNARRFDTDLTIFPKLVRIDAACNEIEAFQKAAPEAVKPD